MPQLSPVTPPVPPNSNLARALFVWTGGGALDSDQNIQDLLDHCETYGINVLFLDIWSYLGGPNWSSSNLSQIQKTVDNAHKSGINVYALSGNVDWGQNHKWVMENILLPLQKYQALSSAQERFDGAVLDVEYWTNETSYPPEDHLPGLLDLVRRFRDHLSLPCGVFSTFWLKDNDSTRATLSYRGKTAQDGEHMMDHCDFVVVGCYYESAAGQEDRFDPWYDYAKDASDAGRNVGLYCGSETVDVNPETITYWEEGRSAMESAHSTISSAYYVTGNSVFLGQAIHDYAAHSSMSS